MMIELVNFNCKFVCRSLVVMGPIFAVLRGVHVHYTISYKIHVHIFIIFIRTVSNTQSWLRYSDALIMLTLTIFVTDAS